MTWVLNAPYFALLSRKRTHIKELNTGHQLSVRENNYNNLHSWSTYYEPGTMLDVLHLIIPLILMYTWLTVTQVRNIDQIPWDFRGPRAYLQ